MHYHRLRRWSLVIVAACASAAGRTGHSQEFCGIDDIFNNGFEVSSFVPTSQLPGGSMSAGLTQDITGSATLNVTLATSGTTSDAMVDVTGTFTGPVNTGIAINGVAGFTANGMFVIPNVPLTSGSNALNVTATILPGTTATTSGSITRSGATTPIAVAVNRTLGFAPFAENFNYLIGTLAGNATISNLAIDFRGIGSNDYNGTLASAPTSYAYAMPGLYLAKFRFTDSNSNVYTIQRAVLVQDIGIQRSMLCDVYGYLKNRLNAQDATGASNVFQPVERTTWLNFFNALGSSMPTAASQLGVVVNGILSPDFADLLLVQDNAANQTRAGFPLRMTQSGDGVWRISEM
ncbi:MAG: hypothetical protein JSS28_08125 [Proteobacteria bacterium]|nr:hypothetical protein [Pseudomonadota bacterium]